MRSIRVRFTNMNEYSNFLRAFEVLSGLGVPSEHHFEKDGAGWFDIDTMHPNAKIDKTLHVEVPDVYIGIEEIMEEADDNRSRI